MRYFLVCYTTGFAAGRSFVKNEQGKFVNLVWFEGIKKCVVTSVFEFKNEQDFLDSQNQTK